jgi:hypothetical protein
MVEFPLEPREAELFELLARTSVGEALGNLEARCDDAEKRDLPARLGTWLARSMELAFWIGMIPQDSAGVTRR